VAIALRTLHLSQGGIIGKRVTVVFTVQHGYRGLVENARESIANLSLSEKVVGTARTETGGAKVPELALAGTSPDARNEIGK
jgi:hypothetical protein